MLRSFDGVRESNLHPRVPVKLGSPLARAAASLAAVWCVVVGVLTSGCDKEGGEARPSVAPAILEAEVPQTVVPGQTMVVSARVTDPQGVRTVRFVLVEIRSAGGELVAVDTLFDDGAYFHPEDGDVVAGDGVFTGRIVWRWSGSVELSFKLALRAVDQEDHESAPVERLILARRNHPPAILQLEAPGRLPSGFEGTQRFRAMVADSEGLADVAMVRLQGLRSGVEAFSARLYDDGTHGDRHPDDGWFELEIDASFGAGKAGEYLLRAQAFDRTGAQSSPWDQTLWIENGPPVVAQVDLPDSVAKPPSGSVAVRITAKVRDPQGLEDIRSVGFLSLKPDGTYANNGQPIPMVDNGLPFDPALYPQPFYGDEVAGDGVFTFTMVVYSDAEAARAGLPPVLKGEYRFRFQAMDWVGQKSETVERVFVVY